MGSEHEQPVTQESVNKRKGRIRIDQKKLLNAMLKAEMTPSELVKKHKFHPNTVRAALHEDDYRATIDTVLRLAKALGISATLIIEEE